MAVKGCEVWTGSERGYQDRAGDILFGLGWEMKPWSWVVTTCGTTACITPEHLATKAPLDLGYPKHQCIYCGRSAWTRDHLLPEPWSGATGRQYVATVPACGTCNSLLGDILTWTIDERRGVCHSLLRRKFAKVLRIPDWAPEQLAEFDRGMRDYILEGLESKREVERMLAWPPDAGYDARALATVGIEDPWAIGLLAWRSAA